MRFGLLSFLMLVSCNGSVDTVDTAIGDDGNTPPADYTPDWNGVQALMEDHCLICHGEGRGNRFVFPESMKASILTGDPYYVIPGNAEGSRLWRVLTGETRDDDFGKMPLAGLLPPSHIQHVADWIDAGAEVGAIPADDDGDGFLAGIDDCDDTDATVNPDADELCDRVDNDCDETIDELADGDDPGAVDATTWYADSDADGFGDPDSSVISCEPPANHTTDNTDCDDTEALSAPGGTEVCDGIDNDCSGTVDPDTATDVLNWYTDSDEDGFGDVSTEVASCTAPTDAVDNGDDCDDAVAAVNPDAIELCNGIDDNCDSTSDEGIPTTTWFFDSDGDGFGDDASTVDNCAAPVGFVALGGDCDEASTAYNPGAVEADCTDPEDYNCDGSIGFSDDDGDGFAACQECDDNDIAVKPGATELCNGVDDNCDGAVDEGLAVSTWYADTDDDGFGNAAAMQDFCQQPVGFVANSDDCDDAVQAVAPDATEACNAIDDDCDGDIDEPGSTGETGHFVDGDGDGHGGSTAISACGPTAGVIATNTDCDDTDDRIHPDVTEICNGFDDNCSGTVDDAANPPRWSVDGDGDGHGHTTQTIADCDQPAGTALVNDDCDDSDGTIFPGQTELEDGRDQNCDGHIDEDFFTYVHSRDVQPIWETNCGGCHGFSSGLTLTFTDAHPNLVNVTATQNTSMKRIVPGDVDASYLWHKLNDTHLSVGGLGAQMPKGGGTLPAGDLEIIETWITEGAPR